MSPRSEDFDLLAPSQGSSGERIQHRVAEGADAGELGGRNTFFAGKTLDTSHLSSTSTYVFCGPSLMSFDFIVSSSAITPRSAAS
jgi:hypothetical protein